jgi:hypothetical protein
MENAQTPEGPPAEKMRGLSGLLHVLLSLYRRMVKETREREKAMNEARRALAERKGGSLLPIRYVYWTLAHSEFNCCLCFLLRCLVCLYQSYLGLVFTGFYRILLAD